MNEAGAITSSVTMQLKIRDHIETIRLMVTKLSSPIFLGHDWLEKHNPNIDWTAGKVDFHRCPPSCQWDAAEVERIGMVRVDRWLELRAE